MATAKLTAAKAFTYGRKAFKVGDQVEGVSDLDLRVLQHTGHVTACDSKKGSRGTYRTRMMTAENEARPGLVGAPAAQPLLVTSTSSQDDHTQNAMTTATMQGSAPAASPGAAVVAQDTKPA